MKKLSFILAVVLIFSCVFFASCGDSDEGATTTNGEDDGYDWNNTVKPVATIEMENGGIIKIELRPDVAPNTVYNFISLANSGFYDGTTFHRGRPNKFIQGGDPDGNGTGNPGYKIKGEFTDNGFKNDLKHVRGTLSMARSQSYDSAGCQFFIVATTASGWDKQYATFGSVIEGIEVVDEISNSKLVANTDGIIETPPVIKSIRVETFGIEYPEPTIIK